jgi:hypothetical protein
MTPKEQARYIESTPTLTGDELLRIHQQYINGGGAGTNMVMQAIARHASLPPDMASWLVTSQPEALAENPALPLLIIEKPNLFGDRPAKQLRRMLHRETVAPFLLQILSTHSDRQVREAAQYHINLAGEAKEGWEDEAKKALIDLAPKNSSALCEMHYFGYVPIWLADALTLKAKPAKRTGEPNTLTPPLPPPPITEPGPSAEIFKTIDQMDNIERRNLANKVGQHPDVLHYLAENDTDRFYLNHIAYNGNVSRRTIELLISVNVESDAIIQNPYIENDIVNKIALERNFVYDNVIIRLTTDTLFQIFNRNKFISYIPYLLKRSDLTEEQRKMVLLYQNMKATQEILRFVSLSYAGGQDVSDALYSYNWVDRFAFTVNAGVNPKLEVVQKALKKLARDGNRFVRAAAQARQKDPAWRFE